MELGYAKPSSRHIKAGFQGRRSYSEVSNVALYQQSRSLWLQPEASTLPKHRPYGEVYLGGTGSPLSAREPFEEHVRFEKQSSDEEEWALPSPPSPEAGAIRCASFCAGFPDADAVHRTAAAYARAEHAQSWPSINVSGTPLGMRCGGLGGGRSKGNPPDHHHHRAGRACLSFPISDRLRSIRVCTQWWEGNGGGGGGGSVAPRRRWWWAQHRLAPPQLLLETVDSEVRSCPLCQLAFPIGYPDDALVKHIDSHLENSKI